MPFSRAPNHQPVVLLAPGPHCHRSRVDTEVRVLHHVGQRLTDGQPQVFAHLGAGSQSQACRTTAVRKSPTCSGCAITRLSNRGVSTSKGIPCKRRPTTPDSTRRLQRRSGVLQPPRQKRSKDASYLRGHGRHWSGSCGRARRQVVMRASLCVRCANRACGSVRATRRVGAAVSLATPWRLRVPPRGRGERSWFGGNRLARDLTLPSLRAGWQQSTGEQQDAVKQWTRWTSSTPRTPDQRRAEVEHRAVRWHQCVNDVDR